MGSGLGDPVQGQQSPDQQPPHDDQTGVGVGPPHCFIILVGSDTPRLRPERLSTRLWPGAVYAQERQLWRPQPFHVLFCPSPKPAARPEGEGRAKRKRKAVLSDSGRLPPLAPQLRLLLPGRAASAIRLGRGLGSGLKGQLQETSSSGHVARPPSPPRPLVGSSGRTQSQPFQAPGPGGRAVAERGGRRW